MKHLLKHVILSSLVAVIVACSSQEGSSTVVASENIASAASKNVAYSESKLLTSLAQLYPKGQIPANRLSQSAKDLAQNPAVLAQTAKSSGNLAAATIQPQALAADFQPVQRIQNASLYGAYFFSIYPGEVTSALAGNPNWALEGPAFWASLAGGDGLSPVHRFQNKNNGSYLYTIYDSERADIVANYSDTFLYEGVAWYAQQSAAAGTGWSALYRFRNKTNGTYLFSAYESEKDAIVANFPAIFELEGVAYYVRQNTPLELRVLAGNENLGDVDGINSAAKFRFIYGMTQTSSGNVYVPDFQNNKIRQITPGGVVSTYTGGAPSSSFADGSLATAGFNFPYGIVSNSADALFVSDYGNHTIRKITASGVTTFAGMAGQIGSADLSGNAARFNNPAGMAIDAANNIYLADSANNNIRKITQTGVVSTVAGATNTASGLVNSTVSADARFKSPSGIAIDASGNLFVADTLNNVIRKITPAGAVSTFAGSSTGVAGYADGTGADALFYSPRGITVDANNNLYVTEYENAKIRKITSNAVVTTVVGTQGGGLFTEGALPKSLAYASPLSVRVFGGELYLGTSERVLKVNGLP